MWTSSVGGSVGWTIPRPAASGPQRYVHLEAPVTPDELARLFHETYERLAPSHNYETRRESAVNWDDVPADNKALMVATAAEVLVELARQRLVRHDPRADPDRS